VSTFTSGLPTGASVTPSATTNTNFVSTVNWTPQAADNAAFTLIWTSSTGESCTQSVAVTVTDCTLLRSF
jgi:hypothetical protein